MMITELTRRITPLAIIDIVILAVLFYYLFLAIRGTRGVQLIKGLVLLFLAAFLSRISGLGALNWFLEKVLAFGALAILIIFQPEFRNALTRLAEPGFLGSTPGWSSAKLGMVVSAAFQMARESNGALIVIERRVGLAEFTATGTQLDGELSKEIICTVFNPGSPLHDGALIISRGRIAAAGCFLPLSERFDIEPTLGSRHRAALGLVEQTDSLVIVVSEERASVALARDGRLMPNMTPERLTRILERSLRIGERQNRKKQDLHKAGK